MSAFGGKATWSCAEVCPRPPLTLATRDRRGPDPQTEISRNTEHALRVHASTAAEMVVSKNGWNSLGECGGGGDQQKALPVGGGYSDTRSFPEVVANSSSHLRTSYPSRNDGTRAGPRHGFLHSRNSKARWVFWSCCGCGRTAADD